MPWTRRAVILQIARDGSLRVNLGIEPGESRNIRPGAHVTLTPLFKGMEAFEGRVAQVQGIVNPQTQLVDVPVTIDRPPRTGTRFGLRLKGEVEIDHREAWTVPRLAVLRDAAGVHVCPISVPPARLRARRSALLSLRFPVGTPLSCRHSAFRSHAG